ncbi:MAG: hypothetical protein JRG97_07605 [Deltaproteobacteria bacterium]|nr:hypothetical protein [Deltaproteobacteria bacterium]MBW2053948.1 hypothetical protein [Deltaproteobacteria bacterium]MBW2140923.1 hypothetical protein [Deltaproteobacteria bacterium]
MEDSVADLAEKLIGMYPEIGDHNLNLDMEYKPEKEYWIIKLEKDDFKLHTFLDKKDAEACLGGVECIYLGVQIGQFVKNFEMLEREEK